MHLTNDSSQIPVRLRLVILIKLWLRFMQFQKDRFLLRFRWTSQIEIIYS